MSDGPVIVDTGPIVAYLVETDGYHGWAVERFRELQPPFVTCEAVLAEAFYLLFRLPLGTRLFFELLDTGLIDVRFDLLAEHHLLRKLALKYESVPMSLADACLVRMAEEDREASVFTLDSDFKIYRKNGRQQIPLIIPEEAGA